MSLLLISTRQKRRRGGFEVAAGAVVGSVIDVVSVLPQGFLRLFIVRVGMASQPCEVCGLTCLSVGWYGLGQSGGVGPET